MKRTIMIHENTILKTEDWAPETGGHLRCYGRVISSCFTRASLRIVIRQEHGYIISRENVATLYNNQKNIK
jgi:hypothetical protein